MNLFWTWIPFLSSDLVALCMATNKNTAICPLVKVSPWCLEYYSSTTELCTLSIKSGKGGKLCQKVTEVQGTRKVHLFPSLITAFSQIETQGGIYCPPLLPHSSSVRQVRLRGYVKIQGHPQGCGKFLEIWGRVTLYHTSSAHSCILIFSRDETKKFLCHIATTAYSI